MLHDVFALIIVSTVIVPYTIAFQNYQSLEILGFFICKIILVLLVFFMSKAAKDNKINTLTISKRLATYRLVLDLISVLVILIMNQIGYLQCYFGILSSVTVIFVEFTVSLFGLLKINTKLRAALMCHLIE